MTYLAIIYASGAVFFLIQAYLYARINRERIIGALTWPLLLFVLPLIVSKYMEGLEVEEAKLRFDERLRCKSIRIGDRWGIGA